MIDKLHLMFISICGLVATGMGTFVGYEVATHLINGGEYAHLGYLMAVITAAFLCCFMCFLCCWVASFGCFVIGCCCFIGECCCRMLKPFFQKLVNSNTAGAVL